MTTLTTNLHRKHTEAAEEALSLNFPNAEMAQVHAILALAGAISDLSASMDAGFSEVARDLRGIGDEIGRSA